jgi:hypothetical protein
MQCLPVDKLWKLSGQISYYKYDKKELEKGHF